MKGRHIPSGVPVVTPGTSGYHPAIVQVTVNDEPCALPAGATVAQLIESLGLGPRRVAVEVNRTLVPRAEYAATPLADGDTVEIIHFVGGG
ncbi:MAG TPA: sulfur carrier protein ThiS [Candidatus Limnocylindria bacterium]|nr:sulfur carrier protein ThiS [Candidatus Limnocylindria bacterium]